jgi:hypothetical protein
LQLHWDGDNDSVDERNLSASLGAGVTPVTVDHAALKRIRDWIWTLPPPAYPFAIDKTLAARGSVVYHEHCVSCHADDRFRDGVKTGDRVGTVEPIEQIGTDRYRLDSYTEIFAANQYQLYPDSPYRFSHFRKTYGYANQPLDGIWARAPYLHNGSVPTVRDLLEPPERRPKMFFRGDDVYDQVNLGFVSSDASRNGRELSRYDTTMPGNGNGGHVYGTSLPESDKHAVIEKRPAASHATVVAALRGAAADPVERVLRAGGRRSRAVPRDRVARGPRAPRRRRVLRRLPGGGVPPTRLFRSRVLRA